METTLDAKQKQVWISMKQLQLTETPFSTMLKKRRKRKGNFHQKKGEMEFVKKVKVYISGLLQIRYSSRTYLKL